MIKMTHARGLPEARSRSRRYAPTDGYYGAEAGPLFGTPIDHAEVDDSMTDPNRSRVFPDDGAFISRKQMNTHQFWEAAAVFVQAPFLAYLMTRKGLPMWARTLAGASLAATLYVDGGLLLSWINMKQGKASLFDGVQR